MAWPHDHLMPVFRAFAPGRNASLPRAVPQRAGTHQRGTRTSSLAFNPGVVHGRPTARGSGAVAQVARELTYLSRSIDDDERRAERLRARGTELAGFRVGTSPAGKVLKIVQETLRQHYTRRAILRRYRWVGQKGGSEHEEAAIVATSAVFQWEDLGGLMEQSASDRRTAARPR